MSRSEHWIGLKPWAYELVRTCLGHKKIADVEGPFSPVAGELYEYEIPDPAGNYTVQEYVQAEPWSSGPMYFIALMRNGQPVPESLWSEEEIEEK